MLKERLHIGLYLLVCVGPLLLGLGYSLLYSLGLIGLLNEGFTLAHWQRLWSSSDALSSLWYSLWLTVVSLAGALLLALAVAWGMLRRKFAPGVYPSLFLPLLFPPLVAGFAFLYLLQPTGVLSRIVHQLGIIDQLEAFPRLVNDNWSLGILVTHIFLVFPVFSLLFIEQSKKLNMLAMQQTAASLGSSRRQFFRRVFAPLLIQQSRPVIALYSIFLLGTYEVPLLLGQNSPRVATVFIREQMSRYQLLDIPVGHAMAVVYTLLVLGIVYVLLRQKKLSLF